MAYKLLGMVVWKVAKRFLRRKYAVARHPRFLLAGGGAALLALVVLAGASKRTHG
jgi:hypothetical protein